MAFRNLHCHAIVTDVINTGRLLLLVLKNCIHLIFPSFLLLWGRAQSQVSIPPRQEAVLTLC